MHRAYVSGLACFVLSAVEACAASHGRCTEGGRRLAGEELGVCFFAATAPLVIEGGFVCPPDYPFRHDLGGGVACADMELDRLPDEVCAQITGGCGGDPASSRSTSVESEQAGAARGEQPGELPLAARGTDAVPTPGNGEGEPSRGLADSTSPGACDVLGRLDGRNACGAEGEDLECDGVGFECAVGEEIDAHEGIACRQCVPRGTAQTAGDLELFLARLIFDSCQNRCVEASDCMVWSIRSSCGECEVLLYGLTDEEVLESARLFDVDYCDGDAAIELVNVEQQPACVEGVCVYPE